MLNDTLITILVSIFVAAWWYLFLLLIPEAYRESALEQAEERAAKEAKKAAGN